jgi:hypothetical protein
MEKLPDFTGKTSVRTIRGARGGGDAAPMTVLQERRSANERAAYYFPYREPLNDA